MVGRAGELRDDGIARLLAKRLRLHGRSNRHQLTATQRRARCDGETLQDFVALVRRVEELHVGVLLKPHNRRRARQSRDVVDRAVPHRLGVCGAAATAHGCQCRAVRCDGPCTKTARSGARRARHARTRQRLGRSSDQVPLGLHRGGVELVVVLCRHRERLLRGPVDKLGHDARRDGRTICCRGVALGGVLERRDDAMDRIEGCEVVRREADGVKAGEEILGALEHLRVGGTGPAPVVCEVRELLAVAAKEVDEGVVEHALRGATAFLLLREKEVERALRSVRFRCTPQREGTCDGLTEDCYKLNLPLCRGSVLRALHVGKEPEAAVRPHRFGGLARDRVPHPKIRRRLRKRDRSAASPILNHLLRTTRRFIAAYCAGKINKYEERRGGASRRSGRRALGHRGPNVRRRQLAVLCRELRVRHRLQLEHRRSIAVAPLRDAFDNVVPGGFHG